jgi:6,7-dimethyl-8-ribityllumazine synthase
MSGHFSVLEARFYSDIANALFEGAEAELNRIDATYERISVPGVLEIPGVLSMIANSEKAEFDGHILLGCVIRGETSHYDIVALESARAIMAIVADKSLAVGNGILTVDNRDQAWERARITQKNKGGAAARAAILMADLRRQFGFRP